VRDSKAFRVYRYLGWAAAGLALGAVGAGFPIFWTALAALLAITLIVLGIVARRLSAATAAA
jgi:Na+-driven multidrug efflux pump